MSPRKTGWLLLLFLMVVIRLASVHAEQPVTQQKHTFIALPELQLMASTQGAASLRGAMSFLRPVGDLKNNWDVHVRPQASIQTNEGTATLFSFANGRFGASRPWSLGISVSFVRLPRTKENHDPSDQFSFINPARLVKLKRNALRLCDDSKAEESFNKLALTDVADLDLCPEGLSRFNDEAKDRDFRYVVPALMISFGAELLAQRFRYLASVVASDPLSEQSSARYSGSAAASLTYVRPDNGLTVEVPFVWAGGHTPSTTVARWCTPAGQVGRDGGGTDPAEVCRELALGAPVATNRFFGALYVGYADPVRTWWRAAAGPTFSYRQEASAGSLSVGIQAPLWFDYTAAATSAYKGLVRITPQVQFVREAGRWDTQVLLTLELLGQRNMFGDALSWR